MILPLNPPIRCEVWEHEDGPGYSRFAHGVLINPTTGDPTGIIVAHRGRFVYVPNDRYQFEWRPLDHLHVADDPTGERCLLCEEPRKPLARATPAPEQDK